MSKITADIARLPLLLHELRLPAISRLWQDIATRADKEGWPATRFLAALAEFEIAERAISFRDFRRGVRFSSNGPNLQSLLPPRGDIGIMRATAG
jgi:hypothetical protein